MKSNAAAVDKQWMGILGDTPPKLEVDFTSTSSSSSGNEPHVSSVLLDASTRTALKILCENEGVSMFTLALGITHQCLRAYSHESYAIGTTNGGEKDNNVLLIPFSKGKEGGKETLKHLNNRWVNDILPLASLPYERFVNMEYGCSVCLAVNIEKDTSTQLPNLNKDESKLDLTIEWMEADSEDGSIKVTFESGIGPWPGLAERFKQIINQIVAGYLVDSKPMSTLTTLLPHEEAQVLEFGTGAKDPIRNVCLHEMFEEQVKKNPDAVALLNNSGTDSMTYGELDRQANELAIELQRLGAKPNTFVGILMGEKSFEMYIAVLGVLKSGAAYVPMDPVLFPPERIKFITEDTNMQALVTVGEHSNLVSGNFTTVLVEEVMARRSHTNPSTLERIVKPSDPAYIIYTSGTTGTPKGVLCNHIGPVNMICYDPVFDQGKPGVDVVGSSFPLIFDPFALVCFGALGKGLSISLDIKCCTILYTTPSAADIYLEDETNDIRALLVGGEACIQGLEKKVSIFRNAYGPTECSIQATQSSTPDNIGGPLPNALCYIVYPDDGSLCPPGVSGELWIGGIGVSLGYQNRPELTDEKFIPNPFASTGKVYKTGDRVKWDKNGDIVFLGRFDHQVKVNGYRIELGEIQAELEKQTGVNGALVLVHNEKLVAFVASGIDNDAENEVSESNIMAALKSEECSLTSYMIPWKILVVNEFPLTLNGKIDRKELLAR